MSDALPKGWANPALGEVVEITSGNSKLTKKNTQAKESLSLLAGVVLMVLWIFSSTRDMQLF